MNEVDKLKATILEYEKRMGIGSSDPAKEGYFVLVDILGQQIEYLKTFKIKDKILATDKDKAGEYKNAKDLWEGLRNMIQSVNSLKTELKIEGEKQQETYIPISAKKIANGEDV